jgi:hypothetical protein
MLQVALIALKVISVPQLPFTLNLAKMELTAQRRHLIHKYVLQVFIVQPR